MIGRHLYASSYTSVALLLTHANPRLFLSLTHVCPGIQFFFTCSPCQCMCKVGAVHICSSSIPLPLFLKNVGLFYVIYLWLRAHLTPIVCMSFIQLGNLFIFSKLSWRAKHVFDNCPSSLLSLLSSTQHRLGRLHMFTQTAAQHLHGCCLPLAQILKNSATKSNLLSGAEVFRGQSRHQKSPYRQNLHYMFSHWLLRHCPFSYWLFFSRVGLPSSKGRLQAYDCNMRVYDILVSI